MVGTRCAAAHRLTLLSHTPMGPGMSSFVRTNPRLARIAAITTYPRSDTIAAATQGDRSRKRAPRS